MNFSPFDKSAHPELVEERANDEIYKQTDDLLYRAKESGRNKLCSS
jgi:PleD family two-component response regulator